jgi:hypothetical protein
LFFHFRLTSCDEVERVCCFAYKAAHHAAAALAQNRKRID